MSSDVGLKIGVRRGKFAALAGIAGVVFLPCFVALAWSFPFAEGLVFADVLIIAGAGLGGGLVTILGGVALRGPVGLRLDRDGLSGYVAPAALQWSDISDLQLIRFGSVTAIAIWLHDPAAYRASLSPLQKLMRQGQIRGAHASINVTGLDMPPNDILKVMRDLWQRHAA